jgi:hypothetical protein
LEAEAGKRLGWVGLEDMGKVYRFYSPRPESGSRFFNRLFSTILMHREISK